MKKLLKLQPRNQTAVFAVEGLLAPVTCKLLYSFLSDLKIFDRTLHYASVYISHENYGKI